MKQWLPKILAVLAVIGLGLGAWHLMRQDTTKPPIDPVRPPATKPYEEAVAGLGIVEPLNEAIIVSPHYSGKITQVHVKEGQPVTVGDRLFTLDTERLEAEAKRLRKEVGSLQAKLARLEHLPRPETLLPLKASVKTALTRLAREQDKLNRLEAVPDKTAIAEQDLTQQRLAVAEAEAALNEAKQRLLEVEAGAWVYEKQEVANQLEAAKARLDETQVLLSQSVVTAPITATVLRVNTRPGEWLAATPPSMLKEADAPVLLGDISALQVRVDIDEVLVSQVEPGADARGFVRGDASTEVALNFERIEPYMVPKANLTGSTSERNDVRVLQVIYTFTPAPGAPFYPGQLLEVYLKKRA